MKLQLTACLALVLVSGCERSGKVVSVIRLVDEFGKVQVTGASSAPSTNAPVEWRFDGTGAEKMWRAGVGISGLAIRDGRLAGRAETKLPIISLEREGSLDDDDLLYEVVVRARASAGANLAVSFDDSEEPDFARIAENAAGFPWALSTPIVPGDDLKTYHLTVSSSPRTSVPSSRMKRVLLQPTDAEGADVEIESVRIVLRKEHLASIPAGVGWQGLDEIYRESIVSRSPEQLRFDVTLPADPVLDLAIGTVDHDPVTFVVTAGKRRFERTITTSNRWEETMVDLGELSRQSVSLTLELRAEHEGTLGFWGAPAIRSRRSPRDGASKAPRGIIVFLLDTTRRDRLEAYGSSRPTTPTVSRLASEGVAFEDAIAQGAWTKVSFPSIVTSTYPSSNGIHEFNDRMPLSGVTLAEVFRVAGYATWASSSVPFSGRAANLHQGVEVLHESGSLHLPEHQPGIKSARAFVDRLLPWLEAHKDVPFFALVHAMDPHSDYQPYPPYDREWAEADAKAKLDEWTEKVKPFIESDFMKGMGLPLRGELEKAGIDSEAFKRLELDWYDGSIRAADVELGRVVEKLEELGLANDTLVVFLSDHGEEFFDHGGSFHEENVYGELVNVPLVMSWPSVLPRGIVVDETVELLDVAPTLVDLAGLPVPDEMQGQSLRPLLFSDSSNRWRKRPAISEWRKRTDQKGTRIVDCFGIIEDGWKLVRNVDRPADVPELELYDHRNDPLDQRNVSSEHPEIVTRLSEQLDRWQKWAVEHKLPTNEQATGDMSSEELDRLRSLGYVQ